MHRLTARITCFVTALAAITGGVSVLPCNIAQAESSASGIAAKEAVPSQSDRKQAKQLIALGDQLANGRGMPRDEVKATQLYQQAAALGDPAGQMRFGQALVFGRGVAVNTEQGISLIKTAAEAGDSSAMVLLADLHMRGLLGPQNRARAVSLLEEAAAKGQLVALVKLGGIYQAGDLVKADPGKAAAYYKRAIAAGRADAMVAFGRALAEGKLKGQGSPSEGLTLLKQAQELGNENAVIALSDCYFYGSGVQPNSKQAMELLKAASDAGNLKAGLRLVSLYRDGRKGIISRDPRLAAITLDRIAVKLSVAELRAEKLLVRAAGPSARALYGQLQTQFDGLPVESRSSLVRRIRGTNLGLYTYLVQSELDRLRIYKGEKSGILSRGTMSAIYSHCIRYELPEVCLRGPLTPRVIEVTAIAFQNNPEMPGLSK